MLKENKAILKNLLIENYFKKYGHCVINGDGSVDCYINPNSKWFKESIKSGRFFLRKPGFCSMPLVNFIFRCLSFENNGCIETELDRSRSIDLYFNGCSFYGLNIKSNGDINMDGCNFYLKDNDNITIHTDRTINITNTKTDVQLHSFVDLNADTINITNGCKFYADHVNITSGFNQRCDKVYISDSSVKSKFISMTANRIEFAKMDLHSIHSSFSGLDAKVHDSLISTKTLNLDNNELDISKSVINAKKLTAVSNDISLWNNTKVEADTIKTTIKTLGNCSVQDNSSVVAKNMAEINSDQNVIPKVLSPTIVFNGVKVEGNSNSKMAAVSLIKPRQEVAVALRKVNDKIDEQLENAISQFENTPISSLEDYDKPKVMEKKNN